NKVYDGNANATLFSQTVTGMVFSESVGLTSSSSVFANKNVGNGKTVTVSGLTLTGAFVGNYFLASTTATTTADITARALTVSATAANKVYDGNANASVT